MRVYWGEGGKGLSEKVSELGRGDQPPLTPTVAVGHPAAYMHTIPAQHPPAAHMHTMTHNTLLLRTQEIHKGTHMHSCTQSPPPLLSFHSRSW